MIAVALEGDEPGSGTAEPRMPDGDEPSGGIIAVACEGDEPGNGTAEPRMPDGDDPSGGIIAVACEADEPGSGTAEPRMPDGDDPSGGIIAVACDADDPGSGTAEPRWPEGELTGGMMAVAPDADEPGSGTRPARSSGGAGIDMVGWALKSGAGIETVRWSGGGPSPTLVASSLNEVALGRWAVRPGRGTVVGEIFTPGDFTASRFEGGGAERLAPGNALDPGSGTAPALVTVFVASFSHGEGPRAAPGNGTPTGATRVGSSSQLCEVGVAADTPGSGTAPPDDDGRLLGPGSGTVPDGDDVGAPGLTGKMC